MTPDDKLLLVDEALALKVEDPKLERIVVLKFFGGLSMRQSLRLWGLERWTPVLAVGDVRGLGCFADIRDQA